jgi:hypothetical protein
MSEKTEKILLAQQELVKPSTIWILFLFLGWSYGSLGKIGKQILFYLTLGGLGVWALIRLFTLSSAIKKYNNTVYQKFGLLEMMKP